MADWDDDDFELNLPATKLVNPEAQENTFEGEDEEEEEVKPTPKPKPQADKKSKAKAKVVVEEPLADPVAEKLRQQRLVEESDFAMAKEMLGEAAKEVNLDEMIPKSEADFITYGKLVAKKVAHFESSIHYATMLKTMIKASTESMRADDVNELLSTCKVIFNEKQKAEKAAQGNKKKSKVGKSLKVERDDMDDIGGRGAGGALYGGPDDDYDFM
mmetsp:Transcript_5212/g.19119  ORF Transcript_5212/g.19119 Transcript_5212/m.19119 type:complete len:215 (-) Transcript_5212:4966-5610(-)